MHTNLVMFFFFFIFYSLYCFIFLLFMCFFSNIPIRSAWWWWCTPYSIFTTRWYFQWLQWCNISKRTSYLNCITWYIPKFQWCYYSMRWITWIWTSNFTCHTENIIKLIAIHLLSLNINLYSK